jgi:RNA polymerase sigma-70 factor (ECF subfamily)
MDENDAIERAQRGDKDAFCSLVDAYLGLAYKTARVLTQNSDDAEDAVQEAWVDAWRAMPRFQTGKPFRPWLLTMVANRCYKRILRNRLLTTPYTSEMAEVIGETPAWSRPDTDFDVVLHDALGRLDNEQRRLLALRFYADLKLDEIADVLEMPLGTVKSRLHKIIVTMREELQVGELAHKREE